ncbi:MAG: nucleotidyl transferase AbiEii/AbiGii toxin family protein [Gammaproteobacteria bacterium]|nr:nucleotidyl transferase AbiEii/AbiGii toxin family protein [Gammaproteobacteria bacterium]
MKYSSEQLKNFAQESGFRAEIIEKVLLLMDLLAAFAEDNILKNSVVLKGGTALNLFYLNLPRLSVDIDLNYIGEIDREKMLLDRDVIEARIVDICKMQGFTIYRKPTVHAGGKVVWRYPSALGNSGNLEIDLNFMYRVPLLPISLSSSCLIGGRRVKDIPVLDIHELTAGKLSALIDRTLGRDLFDAYNLLTKDDLNIETLRLIFTVYAGMTRKKDFRLLLSHQLQFDFKELQNRLLPLLSKQELANISNKQQWAEELLSVVHDKISAILPLRKHEIEFLNALLEFGEIKPDLLTSDKGFQKKVKVHPAINWTAYNVKRNR